VREEDIPKTPILYGVFYNIQAPDYDDWRLKLTRYIMKHSCDIPKQSIYLVSNHHSRVPVYCRKLRVLRRMVIDRVN
jgi:hypothetical protein